MKFVPADQSHSQRWYCAVTGRSADPEGFFDARNVLRVIDDKQMPRDTGYRTTVSAAAVKEMARELGWVSPEEIEKVREAFEAQTAEIELLRERLDKIDQIQTLEAELVS